MAASGYVVGIEPHWVQVVRRDLPVAELDDALVGKTLAQISDPHVGPIVEDQYLRRAVKQTAALKPDMVAITGDIMTYRNDGEIERSADILSGLGQPPLGAFAVLGNHDYGPGVRRNDLAVAMTRALGEHNIIMLRNAYMDVGEGLRVAGLDDLWSRRFEPEHVLPAMRKGRSSLVLCHNPDSADTGNWHDFQGWILCGHTHGGQIQPPFGGRPPILPVNNPRYCAGEVAVPGGARLYINRGLGYTHRVRFNARPEITLFTLTRGEAIRS